MSRQTWNPGRVATPVACMPALQPLFAVVVLAVLLLELLEQAETASPSTAAAAAYLVSLLNVLTAVPLSVVGCLAEGSQFAFGACQITFRVPIAFGGPFFPALPDFEVTGRERERCRPALGPPPAIWSLASTSVATQHDQKVTRRMSGGKQYISE